MNKAIEARSAEAYESMIRFELKQAFKRHFKRALHENDIIGYRDEMATKKLITYHYGNDDFFSVKVIKRKIRINRVKLIKSEVTYL